MCLRPLQSQSSFSIAGRAKSRVSCVELLQVVAVVGVFDEYSLHMRAMSAQKKFFSCVEEGRRRAETIRSSARKLRCVGTKAIGR